MKRGMWIYLFPLTVLAFVAPAVQYFHVIFNLQTRWLCAGLLTLLLLLTGRTYQVLLYDAGLALAANVGWAVLTYSWSEVPNLTLMKSFAFALVSLSLLGGGLVWVSRAGWRRTLDYLLPILGIAMFAGVLGQGAIVQIGTDLNLYQGLTGNPNMLGSLMNMAIPCVLWQAYRFRESKKWLVFWVGLFALIVGILLLSVSRASILAAAITCGMVLTVIGIKRNATFVAIGTIAAASAFIAIPDVFQILEQRYIQKASIDAGSEILASRADVWDESYDQAVKGGLAGGGYGVTIGDTDFAGGFTAVGYGREKGNSQLAIVEETGIVGLALYVIFLVALFKRAILSVRRGRDPEMKVMGALVLGALAGQIAQSVFEAWWVAPGSPESAYFWALAGVALGLSVESRKWLAAPQPAQKSVDRRLAPERLGAFLRRRS